MIKKRDPYRVLLTHPRGELVRQAKTEAAAQAIAIHWKAEHGHEAKVLRWNSDDQRYLTIRRRV